MNVFTRSVLFFILLLACGHLCGQVVVSGFVTGDKGQKLEYVNIGIRNKNMGTYSGKEGWFSFKVPEASLKDTITFSFIGYADESIPAYKLTGDAKTIVSLNRNHYDLKEASISTKKLIERKFGITKYNPVLHFMDGSIIQDDIFEIAQLIHLPGNYAKVTSVNLYINEPRKDSGVFRLNFYQYENGHQAKKIGTRNIMQKKAIEEGWLKFDVSAEQLYLKGDVVAAIEFFPSAGKDIKYEVKVGGTTKTFTRSSSQGQWQTPPHHYRLFVTALTSADKKEWNEPDEEKESLPCKRVYSTHVGDSFSVFVGLPASYSKKTAHKYPVAYLLDANVYFDPMLEYLTKNKKDVILVGIGYSNAFEADSLRERDYTYPRAQSTDTMRASGGGDHFFSFIKDALIPFIDSAYNTDTTRRSLMGHSLGGLFSAYVLRQELTNSRSLFSNYIIASPSLDYCNSYIIKEYEQLQKCIGGNKKIFITVGDKESKDDFTRVLNIFKNKKFETLDVKSKTFIKADHMETALPSFKSGIDFLND